MDFVSLRNSLARILVPLLGRPALVRTGRFIMDQGKLDFPNQFETNGELSVQSVAAQLIPFENELVVLDVGANVGAWAKSMVFRAREARRKIKLHAFEAWPGTYKNLQANVSAWGMGEEILCRPQAVSSSCESVSIFSTGDNEGRNGVYPLPGAGSQAMVQIPAVTVDQYFKASNLSRVHFLKIDTEGHDQEVLKGAGGTIRSGHLDLIQFEYNTRWIDSRHFLRDAFELLSLGDYAVGKVTPLGIELYQGWHPELESFREANFIAIRNPLVGLFKTLRWWRKA